MPSVVRTGQDAGPTPTVFVGIDPGVSGGIAITGDGMETTALAMPKTEGDVWQWFDFLDSWHKESAFACIEQVGGWVGGHNRGEGDDGTTSNPGSAMFTFGQSYGGLRMALVAAGIPFEAVRPQAWQRALGLVREDGMDSSAWKRYLKSYAQAMYPQLKVTLRTADAILIATYAKMKWGAT